MRAMDKRIIANFNRLVSRSGYAEEELLSAGDVLMIGGNEAFNK